MEKNSITEIESKDSWMRSFIVVKDGERCRVNVWANSKNNLFTVGTYLNHPKQGKTQLFRKFCTKDEVKKILENPRLHTNKGYR